MYYKHELCRFLRALVCETEAKVHIHPCRRKRSDFALLTHNTNFPLMSVTFSIRSESI